MGTRTVGTEVQGTAKCREYRRESRGLSDDVEIEVQPSDNNDPDQGEQGDADTERAVLGLVAEQLHAQPCADAAAQRRQKQQRLFRDAAGFGSVLLQLCQQLIQTVGQQRQNVDDQEP